MLGNLQSHNPKQYWKLVDELKDQPKNSNIDITKIFNHYKDLNNPEPKENNESDIYDLEQIKIFSQLDFSITDCEINNALKGLKRRKTHGPDLIKNEMLKCGQNLLLKPLHKLFNMVLNSGYYPREWSKGRIVSIHKKGDPGDPANYRGITISSAVGKLFNSILNTRLCNYLDDNAILCPEQSGFRRKHRTTDHMFILKNIMNKYKVDKKCIYIAFVDFK